MVSLYYAFFKENVTRGYNKTHSWDIQGSFTDSFVNTEICQFGVRDSDHAYLNDLS